MRSGYVLYRLILCIFMVFLLLAGCKKDPNAAFRNYTGQWKPASFSCRITQRNTPPWFPPFGEYAELKDGKLIVTTTEMIYTTPPDYKTTMDTLEFVHSLKTSLKGDDVLVISERYIGLNKSGAIVRQYDYESEVKLVEGVEIYNEPYHLNKRISDSKIEFDYVYYDSYFNTQNRVLLKQ